MLPELRAVAWRRDVLTIGAVCRGAHRLSAGRAGLPLQLHYVRAVPVHK